MLRNLAARMAAQIALAIFLVVAISGILTYVRVSQTVEHNTALRFRDTVSRGAGQAEGEVEETLRLALSGAGLVAGGPAIVERFAAGDVQGLARLDSAQRAAFNLFVTRNMRVAMYDAAGRLLLGQSPVAGNDAVPPVVRRALSGAASQGLRNETGNGLVFAAAAPVIGSGGTVLGVVEVSATADEHFVSRLARLTGAEVAIVSVDGTTVHSVEDLNPTVQELDADPAATDRPVELSIGGEAYLAMVVPLVAPGGERLALLYVGVERDAVVAEQQAAQRQVLAGATVAMAIGALLAAGLAVLFTRPMTALVRSARRIQQNDLASPVPRGGPLELHQLGAAMDEMRVAIREARENLIGANAQLAERADVSAAGLAALTQELGVMHGITTGLAQAPGDGPRVVTEQLTRLHWIDGACVLLRRADGRLAVEAHHGMHPGAPAVLQSLARADLDGRVPLEGMYFEDAAGRGPFQALVAQGVRAMALLPLSLEPRGRGLLAVCAEQTGEFSDSHRSLLQAVRAELAAAVERHELAYEVEESRRLAESVLREMQDGAIVLDTEGRCEVCNPAALRMLGLGGEDVAGRPVEEWIPVPAATMERLRLAADGGGEESPSVLIDVDGRLLGFAAGPLLEPDGRRRGLILLVRDMTETVAAERLKQDFVSMVGHELRTPLTLIRTSVDLLTEEGAGELTPTQRRITEVLHNNSDRLLRLINDLLDMSALDSGRLRVQSLPVGLRSVIAEVLPNYRHEAAVREIAVEVDVPAEDVVVWADRARIGQVLSNLLDNAMKYTPSGGRITVRVVPGDPYVLVQVQDNGIGILPSEQPLLFQKFQRTAAGERQSGGTGLGLAIARSIVELHGGKIWCESDGKSGSTFSFTLPSREPDGASAGGAASDGTGAGTAPAEEALGSAPPGA